MDLYHALDMKGNEIINFKAEKLSADPTDAVDGRIYYNTVENALKCYVNGFWIVMGSFADMSMSVYDTDKNGIVDNAEKVNGLTVETAVPENAVFTDTVTSINGNTGVIALSDLVAIGIATSEELDTAISNLIDNSPDALNTLAELSAALGDDSDFATTVTNSLANKLDKTSYTAADVLAKLITVLDSTHRFVTDAEKATWNSKQNALGYTPENAANKGVAGGYASLNDAGYITADQIDMSSFGSDSTTISTTLSTSWSVSDDHYYQTFTNENIESDSIIDLTISSSATKTQIGQWNMLNLFGGTQSDGSFIVNCWGDINTVDIPIVYTIVSPNFRYIDSVVMLDETTGISYTLGVDSGQLCLFEL